jgi:hypothetical protein
MTKTESIKRFLEAKTHADLAYLYNAKMECQVNVAQDGGDRIDGEFRGRQWTGWTDGIQQWKPFRIPRNANTDPEYQDSEMTYDLAAHAEGIGMTGWNWVDRKSMWVAFDFDAIAGHATNHNYKVSDIDLEHVKQAAINIPWVTVRKSAGGKGLHLYVHLKHPETTENHTEHASLARAILGQMAAVTGFDFSSKVDVCGGNMWVWHRKMLNNDGLTLIKNGELLENIPVNWRDHLEVIKGTRKRSLFVPAMEENDKSEAEKLFNELTSQTLRTPLDEGHKKLINWLGENWPQTWWDADRWMLVTHTAALKLAHEDLKLRGIFETIAQGTEQGRDHNAFCYPLNNGGWAVRRYGLGVKEHESWEQDGQGWTRCYYNLLPDLRALAKSVGALEKPEGGFVFQELEIATQVAKKLGATDIEVHSNMRSRKTLLKESKDGRVIIEFDHDATDMGLKGWLCEKGKWRRVLNATANPVKEKEIGNYDNIVRHLITGKREDYGWVIKGEKGWHVEPLVHVRLNLKAMGYNPKELDPILGASIQRCWTLVNMPFQPEYPGGRLWNRDAAQLKVVPSQKKEGLHYPTWKKILEHCGQGLNDAIKINGWARANAIYTGAEYLKVWFASLFKEPFQPLPYLFLYGPEESGKSILYESISLLFTNGYSKADAALTNPQGFNGELASAVLCVVEEINLSRNQQALNRIKDWVTALELSIHPKGETPYHIPNTSHWIQAANDISYCPIFPGDTRITMIFVPPLDDLEKIPKRELLIALEKEAPDFLAELLNLEIPPSDSRLNIPVIRTVAKAEIEKTNRSAALQFLDEKCHYVPGQMILLGELYEAFLGWVDFTERGEWGKTRFVKMIPPQFPKGRSKSTGQHFFGNISFDPKAEKKTRLKAWTDDKEQTFLVPEDENDKGNTR